MVSVTPRIFSVVIINKDDRKEIGLSACPEGEEEDFITEQLKDDNMAVQVIKNYGVKISSRNPSCIIHIANGVKLALNVDKVISGETDIDEYFLADEIKAI